MSFRVSADKQPNGRPIKSLPAPSYERIVQRRRYLLTNLNTAAAAVLHQIADVSRFRACSDERPYVVVVKLLQLQNNSAFGVNVTLFAFAAERRPCSNQSIFLARLVYSSQPAAADRRADRQTDDRQFHRPRSSYYVSSVNKHMVSCTRMHKYRQKNKAHSLPKQCDISLQHTQQVQSATNSARRPFQNAVVV